jgi:hypothetical protein
MNQKNTLLFDIIYLYMILLFDRNIPTIDNTPYIS